MKTITKMSEIEAIEAIKKSDNMMWLALSSAGESAHQKRPSVLKAIEEQKAIIANQ